jgi:folate-binding protein YgfZ
MRFWTEVDVDDVGAEWAAVWHPAGDDGSGHVTWRPAPGHPLPGRLVLVPRDHLAAYADTSGPLAGTWAFDALRVAAGVARLGVDTDDRTIPHELGWIGTAVALDKGCYRGQETVARVHNIGRPPRRLVLLHLDGSAATLPKRGDPVTAESQEVGRVGSVVQHYELGPIALALVRRAVPLALPLEAAGVAASQEEPALFAHVPEGGAGRAAQRSIRGPS